MQALRRGARMIILAVTLDSLPILGIGLASTPLHAPGASSFFHAYNPSAGFIAALIFLTPLLSAPISAQRCSYRR
jgi:hypothetical protein